MAKWRRGLDKVLTDLESILQTYESFICGNLPEEDKNTFADELIPLLEEKPRRTNDPSYVKIFEIDKRVIELENELTTLPQCLAREVLQQEIAREKKQLQQHRMRFVGECERSMVAKSQPAQKGGRAWEGHEDVRRVFELWYDGSNEKHNRKLRENGDDPGRYPTANRLSDRELCFADEFGDFANELEGRVKWLRENYYKPFMLRDRAMERQKTMDPPKAVIQHRQRVLEILREIEDYMDAEMARDLTDGTSRERKTKLNYLPDQPTPYHLSHGRKEISAAELAAYNRQTGFEDRGWRSVTPRERKT